jgi:hypothetical protein
MIPEAAAAAEGAAAGGSSSLRAAASRKAGSSAKANRGAGSPAAKRAASRVAPPPRSSQGGASSGSGGGGGPKGKGSTPSKAKSRAQSITKRSRPKKPTAPKPPGKSGKGKSAGRSGLGKVVPQDASKLVLAEFVVCLVILILSPLSSKGSKDLDKGGALDMMLKASALSFVFFVLALISAGGRSASRISAGFGGVITLGYLVAQGDVFAQLAKLFTTPAQRAGQAGAAAGAAGA